MKTCKRCGDEKQLVYFNKDKRLKDGHAGTCSKCSNERRRNNRKNK